MEKNWIEKPTKKQTIVFGSIGIVGVIFSILSMTNFLTESPFNKKYFVFFILFILTAVNTTKIISNYLKQKKL